MRMEKVLQPRGEIFFVRVNIYTHDQLGGMAPTKMPHIDMGSSF